MLLNDIVRNFGQMFILAFDGPQIPPEVAEFCRTFRIGGLILFADNYQDSRQLKDLIAKLQTSCATANTPLFIATDHEGGRVQRFKKDFTEIGPMCDYGLRTPQETEAIHRTIASELKAVGVNLNCAPVADLCQRDTAGAIGDRAFGSDPMLVAAHVAAAVRGLQAEGIIACAKHFPGHGATVQDSHVELPQISLSLNEMMSRDLLPFSAAVKAGVKAVMTAHAFYPKSGDPQWPATLSYFWLTEVLRNQMRFPGLIITDAIEMKGLLKHWSPQECGYHAIRAGADIIIYYKEAHQFEAFIELRCALESGELDPAPIASRLERISMVKKNSELLARN
jgi:beta-N-acetylhexosaminidase